MQTLEAPEEVIPTSRELNQQLRSEDVEVESTDDSDKWVPVPMHRYPSVNSVEIPEPAEVTPEPQTTEADIHEIFDTPEEYKVPAKIIAYINNLPEKLSGKRRAGKKSGIVSDLQIARDEDHARSMIEGDDRIWDKEKEEILRMWDNAHNPKLDKVIAPTITPPEEMDFSAIPETQDEAEVVEQKNIDDLIPPVVRMENDIDFSGGVTPHVPTLDEVIPQTVPPVEEMDFSKTPETPVVIDEFETEFIKGLEKEVIDSRLEYLTELVKYKKQKSYLRKQWAKLGIADKQNPENWSPELKQAEAGYIEAKRQKSHQLLEKSKSGTPEEQMEFRMKLREEALDEFETLNTLLESMMQEEKGRIGKAIEKFHLGDRKDKALEVINKWPASKRSAAIAGLLGVGGLAIGTFGLMGAVGYTGMRMARVAGSAMVGKYAGKKMDEHQREGNEKRENESMEKYTGELDIANYAEKERELMRSLEDQVRIKKRQKIYKTAVVLGTAVGTGVGSGMLGHHLVPSVPADMGLMKGIKDKFEIQTAHAAGHEGGAPNNIPVGPKVPEYIDTEIKVSGKGFIQTFADMKAKLATEYVGKDMPGGVKHILDTTPEKLAQEYGMYDAKHGLSGLGMKGDLLEINKDGDLIYKNTGGEHLLSNAEGTVKHSFTSDEVGGKMMSPKVVPESDTASHPFNNEKIVSRIPQSNTMIEESPALRTPLSRSELNKMEDEYESKLVELSESSDPGMQAELTAEAERMSTELRARLQEIETHRNVLGNLSTSPDSIQTPYLSNTITPPASVLGVENISYAGVGTHNVVLENNFGSHVLKFDGRAITHENVIGNLKGDTKILALDDAFQNDPKFKYVREAYKAGLEKAYPRGDMGFGSTATVFPVDFEGGTAHIVRGIPDNPNGIKVLLNGKEIAHGIVDKQGPHIEFDKKLKSGIFRADNAYERVFNQIKPFLKKLKKIK